MPYSFLDMLIDHVVRLPWTLQSEVIISGAAANDGADSGVQAKSLSEVELRRDLQDALAIGANGVQRTEAETSARAAELGRT
jgi:hypothetical protein